MKNVPINVAHPQMRLADMYRYTSDDSFAFELIKLHLNSRGMVQPRSLDIRASQYPEQLPPPVCCNDNRSGMS